MAIQQVVPISILLQGDGSTGTFVFNLGDVYQISSGSAVNYGNLGFIPTGISVPNPPAPLVSATIDSATGIITLTLLAPIPAGVILNFVLNLLFNSGDAIPFPGPFEPTTVMVGNLPAIQPVSGTITAKLQDGSGNPISSTGGSINANITNFPSVQPISGTVSISGTVPISGSISVSNFPASQVVTLASTTITGSVAVTGTFFQATQPVSGTIAVSNFPATQPVSGTITANAGTGTFTVGGTVAVSNFPATQPVSGTVAVSNFPASQVVTLASTTITGSVAVTGTFFQATQPVSGTIAVSNFPALQNVNLTQLNGAALGSPTNYGTAPGAIAVQAVNAFVTNSVAVTGTFFPATQPVSNAGTFAVQVTNFPASQVVTLASTTITGTVAVTQSTSPWVVSLASTTITGSVAVTGTFWQAIQPVSGTITANQGTSPWVVSLASTTITGTVAVTQSTTPWIIAGNLTNNNAAPAATNIGALTAIVEPAWNTIGYTTGDLVLPTTDAHGAHWVDLGAVAAVQLGATAIVAFGSIPAAVNVPAVNAFVTNPNIQYLDGTAAVLNGYTGTVAMGWNGAALVGLRTDIRDALNINLFDVAGTACVAASAGVQKVGVSGATGATLDGAINGAAPTNAVWTTPAPSTAAAAACSVGLAAALNVKNIKASPGNIYGCTVANKASLIIYLQFYNTAGVPVLGTGVVGWIPIASGASLQIPPGTFALQNFTTGIGIGAATSATGTGVPPVAPDVSVWYV